MAFAVGNSSTAVDNSPTLQWGRPQIAGRVANPQTINRPAQTRQPQPRQLARVVRDTRLVTAVWERDDTLAIRQTSGVDRSVVVERATPAYDPPTYDPFDEDDRLAQLPDDPLDDPFDEPAGESIPVPEPEDDMDSVEKALEIVASPQTSHSMRKGKIR